MRYQENARAIKRRLTRLKREQEKRAVRRMIDAMHNASPGVESARMPRGRAPDDEEN